MKTIWLYTCCIAVLIGLSRCSPQKVMQQSSSSSPPPSVLLGEQPRSAFELPPFKHWFDSIYQGYAADAGLLKKAWTDEQVPCNCRKLFFQPGRQG